VKYGSFVLNNMYQKNFVIEQTKARSLLEL
jgi:hypothetical protein